LISQKMQDSLNDQIQAEFYSAYLYLAMAAYMESMDLDGFANWMRIQAEEELTHAMKFYGYVNEAGARVILQAVETPPKDWNSPLAAFEAALSHEKHMTQRIYAIANLCTEEKDHATSNLLQWFISEQVEEESNVDSIIKKLKLVGDQGAGVFMIDRDLATRVFVDETAEA